MKIILENCKIVDCDTIVSLSDKSNVEVILENNAFDDELKHCPFCGSCKLYEGVYSGSPIITCQNIKCGASIGGEESNLTEKQVRFAWNSRAINIKDFGAIGDGVTDDTKAFQATIVNSQKENFDE